MTREQLLKCKISLNYRDWESTMKRFSECKREEELEIIRELDRLNSEHNQLVEDLKAVKSASQAPGL